MVRTAAPHVEAVHRPRMTPETIERMHGMLEHESASAPASACRA